MKRWLLLLGVVIAAAGLTVSILGMFRFMRRVYITPATSIQPEPRYADLTIPPFVLTDQDGRRVDEEMFQGRITVLDFIFTNCPFACPMMTLAMQDIAKALPHTQVRFVSISVDPQRDTPERLRQYATDRGIDLSRWSFLTGDFQTVKSIASGALMFALEEDPARPIRLPDGTSMSNILHPTKLILIGPDGKVHGIYSSEDPETVRELAHHARQLAK
ncbi:MAG: SCO family protein [Phycisphaerales bacterium]